MFGFIKKVFVVAMTFFSCNSLKCISMNNLEYEIRPKIININSDEPSSYHFSVEINKWMVVIIILMMENYMFLMLLKT